MVGKAAVDAADSTCGQTHGGFSLEKKLGLELMSFQDWVELKGVITTREGPEQGSAGDLADQHS
jgi:hypothetical protein